MKMPLAAAAVIAVAVPSAAQSGVMMVGQATLARACYEAAESGRVGARAIEPCNQSLRLEPLNTDDRMGTYVNRGVLYLRAGQFARAGADFDAALALQPDQPDALINKAMVLLQDEGTVDAALALLNRAVAAHSARPWVAYYGRGLAYEIGRQDAQAYADYQRALELKPDWALPRAAIGRFSIQPAAPRARG